MRPHYRLLGGLALGEHAESAVSLPPFRGQGLLALLLLRPGRSLSRRALAQELYPEATPAAARVRLSDHLHLLKKADPGLELMVDEQSIGWTGLGRVTDVQLLFADEGSMERSLNLYTGPLLPEFDLPTVVAERAQCRQHFALGLDRLTRLLEASGRLSEALVWSERWLDQFPVDEQAMTRVLGLCRAQGYANRGWESYLKFEKRLERELKSRPTAELRRMASELRQRPGLGTPTSLKVLSEAVRLDRAFVLQDRAEVERLVSGLRSTSNRHPAWKLRELAYVELAGDRAVLLAEASQTLSWSVTQNLQDDEFRRFQAVCLVYLSRAQAEVDSTTEALRSLERAASLLERGLASGHRDPDELWDSPFVSSDFLHAAVGLQRVAVQEKAGTGRSTLEEASRLRTRLEAGVNDDRRIWSECLLLRLDVITGGALSHMGKVRESLVALEQARDRAVSLGAAAFVDTCDLLRTGCYDVLGLWGTSEPILRDLVARRRAEGDTFKLGQTLYNLAAHLGGRPDTDLVLAHALASEAAGLFASLNSEGWRASTLTTLGYLSWQVGEHRRALAEYSEALELHTRLGEELFVTEIHGYRALALIGLGQVEDALAESERGINASLIGSETSVACDSWIARFLCLKAAHRPEEARTYLIRAADHAYGEALELADAEACRAFLQRDPLMRRLHQELNQAGLLAEYQARLPHLEEKDRSQPSSVALRRIKLLEAWRNDQSRNIRPTVGRLAKAIGVSPRSVERDLAALRSQGLLT